MNNAGNVGFYHVKWNILSSFKQKINTQNSLEFMQIMTLIFHFLETLFYKIIFSVHFIKNSAEVAIEVKWCIKSN